MPFKPKTALVLSGGGTRGAYEAGVIQYIRTRLPQDLNARFNFDILAGTSVGAINAAFLAAYAHDPLVQGQKLAHLWKTIQTHNVYKRGPFTLGKFLLKTVVGSASHVVGAKGLSNAKDTLLEFQSLFDTEPFIKHLFEHCPFSHISKNISAGFTEALAISATNLHTGQLEFFVEKNPQTHFEGHHIVHEQKITPRHVMASAALPVLFPPVLIQGKHYNDGSLKLNTPLTPVVSLGATHVMVVGTRTRKPNAGAETPSLAGIIGKLFAAVFSDRVDTDRKTVEKINLILGEVSKHVPPETFAQICKTSQSYPINILTITPSIDIAQMVDDQLRKKYRELKTFGVMERTILRLLEIDVKKGSELLSYFLFEPSFIQDLITLGFNDAKQKHDELMKFAQDATRNK